MTSKLFETNDYTDYTIPYSNNYSINRIGTITDTDGKVLKPVKHSLGWMVNLPMEDGGTLTINVATLTSIVFKGSTLHWKLWKSIKLFFLDNDIYNVNPDNIAHRIYPDNFVYIHEDVSYKIIPNFTRYGISKDGVYFNSETKGLSHGSKDTCGYTVFGMKCDYTNRVATVGRHRHLGLCYKEYPIDVDNLQVNHLDHTPSSDALSNLEWSTKSGNQLHSYHHGGGQSAFTQEIVVYNAKTNTIHSFDSIQMACREFNLVHNNMHKFLDNHNYPIVQRHFRIVRPKADEVYDMNHPIVTTLPTQKDYMTQGKLHVKDSNGVVVWTGDNFVELIDHFKLPYANTTGPAKKFKRGTTDVVAGHKLYIELGHFAPYYGGDIPT